MSTYLEKTRKFEFSLRGESRHFNGSFISSSHFNALKQLQGWVFLLKERNKVLGEEERMKRENL